MVRIMRYYSLKRKIPYATQILHGACPRAKRRVQDDKERCTDPAIEPGKELMMTKDVASRSDAL